MKIIVTLAGATALAIGGPALAQSHGHGKGHGNSHGYSDHGRGYGHGGCPPGLRNKGCMPPGQMRKLSRGDRFRSDYGTYYSYGRIPLSIRRQYDLSPRYRYYYDNGSLYGVNPRTMIVQQVISALLR